MGYFRPRAEDDRLQLQHLREGKLVYTRFTDAHLIYTPFILFSPFFTLSRANNKSKNAYIWIYLQGDQTAVEGRDSLSYRVFNRGYSRKAFCKHCGVHMFNERNPLTGKSLSITSCSEAAVLSSLQYRLSDSERFLLLQTRRSRP